MCQRDCKGQRPENPAARDTERTRAHEEHKAMHQVRSGNPSARQRHGAPNGLTLHEKEEGVTGRAAVGRGDWGTESNDMSGQN